MTRLRPLRFLPALVLATQLATAATEGWLIDFEKARKQAAAEKKDLLVDFTGSDWCGYCIQLSQDVFATEAFRREAPKNFVLVEVDFPEDTSHLAPETLRQNATLAEKYGIEGYPTIILMDAAGRPYARTGFRPGGPERYLAHLEELRQVRRDRDRKLAAAAAGVEGVEKARLLAQALAKLPEQDVETFYKEVVDELVQADPDDEAGFQKARDYRGARDTLIQQVEARLGSGELDEAAAAIDAFLAQHKPEGLALQEVLMGKVMVLVERRQAEAALAQLEAIRKIDPDSEVGREVDNFKESITSYLSAQGSSEEGSSE